MLALQMQRPPGSRQHHQARRGPQQRGDHTGRPVQLLEVVEHQQRPAAAQIPGHRFLRRPVPAGIQVGGDRLPHHLGIADGRQRDKEHAMLKCLAQRCGGGQDQPGLAHAAGAGERHQPYSWPGDGGAKLR